MRNTVRKYIWSCPKCKKHYFLRKSQITRRNKNGSVCKKCFLERDQTNNKNKNWKTRIPIRCVVCKKTIFVPPCRSNTKTCSKKCLSILMKSYIVGENNPTKRLEVRKKLSDNWQQAIASGKRMPPIQGGYRYNQGEYIDKKGNSHHYHSGWELKRMQFLDKQHGIQWKKLTVEYRIPYLFKNKHHTYFPDFKIKCKNKIVVEEIGKYQKEKKKKIKAALKYFKNRPETFIALGRKQLNERTW